MLTGQYKWFYGLTLHGIVETVVLLYVLSKHSITYSSTATMKLQHTFSACM